MGRGRTTPAFFNKIFVHVSRPFLVLLFSRTAAAPHVIKPPSPVDIVWNFFGSKTFEAALCSYDPFIILRTCTFYSRFNNTSKYLSNSLSHTSHSIFRITFLTSKMYSNLRAVPSSVIFSLQAWQGFGVRRVSFANRDKVCQLRHSLEAPWLHSTAHMHVHGRQMRVPQCRSQSARRCMQGVLRNRIIALASVYSIAQQTLTPLEQHGLKILIEVTV